MDTSEIYIKMSDCDEVQEQQPYAKDAVNSFFHRKEMRYIESKTIWLPRQDQIQEIVGVNNEEPFCDWLLRLEKFTHIAQPWEIPIDKSGLKTIGWFESMEQLWLAFYMYEKHKKTWDGDKWVSTAVDKKSAK